MHGILSLNASAVSSVNPFSGFLRDDGEAFLLFPMSSMSNPISVLAAAVLAAAASAAGAVSLGDLNIQSIPGQPLDATLEVKDVDLTISPLLVRVAPPATYLREGVQWPQEALDLRMARLSGEPSTVRVRVTGTQSLNAGFPLLIELNAGGNVTVREYRIERTNGSFNVVALAEEAARTKAPAEAAPEKAAPVPEEKPAPAANAPASVPESAPAVTPPAAEKAKPQETVQKTQKPRRRIGRAAPLVVREYVALNGFNPNESFRVQRDMTLWSIAKLYWPSYPGALLEQVAVALTDKNPRAFVEGDPSRIVVGELLLSPAQDEVFAIDALQAFRKVHGESVEVPGPTQNLIDAQKASRAGAAEVAAAQLAASAKGEKPEAVADAGRKAFAQWQAETSDLEEARADSATAAPNAPEKTQPAEGEGAQSKDGVQKDAETLTPAPEPQKAEAAPEPQSAGEPAEAQKTKEPLMTGASEAAASAPAAEEAPQKAEEKPAESSKPADAGKAAEEPLSGPAGASKTSWGALAALVVAIMGGLLWWRRREGEHPDQDQDDHGPKKEGTIAIQRNVPPTSEAQLKAVDATIDEAVKNGTTAGAMGAGAMAYAAAQMEADRKAGVGSESSEAAASGSEEKPVKEEDDMLSSFEAALKTPLEIKPQAAETTSRDHDALPAEPLQNPVTSRPAPADQPWLAPDDAELPPLESSEVESAEEIGKRYQGELPPAIQKVDLSLDDMKDEASEAAKPVRKPFEVPEPSQGYVPPLMSEPVPEAEPEEAEESSEKPREDAAAAESARPEAAPEPEPILEPGEPQPVVQPDKQEAQQEAIDAKLSLAGSFIGLGATNEARELLEEVKKSGSDRQRERAIQLLERLGSAKA